MAKDYQLGDAPVEARYRQQMEAVGRGLDAVFNGDRKGRVKDRKTGFVLMVFAFGDVKDGRCNYLSNGADRDDIVVLMKEMIRRFEGGADVPPGRA